MKIKILVFFLLYIVFVQPAFAQKINRFGLKMTLEKEWAEKTEITEKIRINAQKKSAILEIYPIGKASTEEAGNATIEVLKNNNVAPEEFEKVPSKNVKLGKISLVTFEWEEETNLESQNTILKQWKSLYLTEYKGNKYIIWASEYYSDADAPSTKAQIETMLKSIR
jgi:hypothetical protein